MPREKLVDFAPQPATIDIEKEPNINLTSTKLWQNPQQTKPQQDQAALSESAQKADFKRNEMEVIFADDDEIFVDMVKAAMTRHGVSRDGIRFARDGLEAMELLLSAQASEEDRPLLLLLDLRMPNMDGRECATRAHDMVDKGMLRRPPYVVGYSSHPATQAEQFHKFLPKDAFIPPSVSNIDGPLARCLCDFERWWLDRFARITASWQHLNLASAECVIADRWPICRMTLQISLKEFGIQDQNIHETDDEEETLEELEKVAGKSEANSAEAMCKPVLVFLERYMDGQPSALCASRIQHRIQKRGIGYWQGDPGHLARCEAFVVCVYNASWATTFSEEEKKSFHCFLPKVFTPHNMKSVLQLFRLWWYERDAAIRCVGGNRQEAQKGITQVQQVQVGNKCLVAKDLGSAMQEWRQRKMARREARRDGTYGMTCRRRTKMQRLDAEALEKQFLDRFPEQKVATFKELLGSGSQANVYLGKWCGQDGSACDVAIKVFHQQEIDEKFRRELEIGKSIRHPNLLTVFEGSVESPLMIIQEYCAGGTVLQLLQDLTSGGNCEASHDKVPTLPQRLKILCDVAKGMAALHARTPPIVHRDLKSENVLLVRTLQRASDIPVAKVADFGTARVLPMENEHGSIIMTQETGTLRWMAPEVMSDQKYGTSADVYSFGVFFFELLTASVPYSDDKSNTPAAFKKFVTNGGRPDARAVGLYVIKALKKAPKWAAELMHSAWEHDPNDRPSFPDIIKKFEENQHALGGMRDAH